MYCTREAGGGNNCMPFATAVGVELKPSPCFECGELHQGKNRTLLSSDMYVESSMDVVG